MKLTDAGPAPAPKPSREKETEARQHTNARFLGGHPFAVVIDDRRRVEVRRVGNAHAGVAQAVVGLCLTEVEIGEVRIRRPSEARSSTGAAAARLERDRGTERVGVRLGEA